MIRDNEQSLAFLQRRIGQFGLVVGLFDVLAMIVRGMKWIPSSLADVQDVVAWAAHVAACVPLLAIWWIARGRPRSLRFLRCLEAIGILVSTLALSAMGYALTLSGGVTPGREHGPTAGQYIVLLALNYIVMARAVFIPSSPRRTLWLTGVSAAGLFLSASPLLNVATHDVFGAKASPYFGTMMGIFAWWLMTTCLATLATSTIYGLRLQVREALQCGEYTLEEKIGEGGMGVVYRARHGMLRRPTAVKLLPASASTAPRIARFEDEVQHTARLSHPNTVTIFDYGRTPEGIFYYAMELLDGETVQDTIDATGPMPPERVAKILMQIAGALDEAHSVGSVHRDVKPSNVVLCNQGGLFDFVKVLDFGLAESFEREGKPSQSHLGIVGTPLYLAPEGVLNPAVVGPPADVYALGGIGYFMLTGEPVFPGKSILEIGSRHLHAVARRPSERSPFPVPEALENLLLRCLAKAEEERPTAASVVRELASVAVQAWSAGDAAAWWQEHRTRVHAQRKQSDANLTPGLTVRRGQLSTASIVRGHLERTSNQRKS
ncbi:serine/threonine protein kinase [Pendulispora rubella]|uniref:Serine/threonine protein kinase n=1 Tax=Pendulispora rubella TaxID=2741070 RepID=A0ABZ2L7Q9_9BACT